MTVVTLKSQRHGEIPFQLNTSIDLSDINNENLLSLKLSHAAFKSSQKKLADELFISCQQMHLMHEILGARIFQFVEEEFGIKPKTARRYLHSYKILSIHFSTDGRIDIEEVRQFTQTALQLLAEDTNEEVILEIRNIAQAGGVVNEATVKKLLDDQSGDFDARLRAAQIETASVRKELASIGEKHELELSRLEKVQKNSIESERRLRALLAEHEEEIAALQKASIQVQTVDREVIPAGYKSTLEAIQDAKNRHQELVKKITSLHGELALIESQKAEIKNDFDVLKVCLEDVTKFKDDISSAFLKMPHSRLTALAASHDGIQEMLRQLGQELISRGQLLISLE